MQLLVLVLLAQLAAFDTVEQCLLCKLFSLLSFQAVAPPTPLPQLSSYFSGHSFFAGSSFSSLTLNFRVLGAQFLDFFSIYILPV